MKETTHSGQPTVVVEAGHSRRSKRLRNPRCSICDRYTWFDATHLMEPVGAPEPRQSWVLCKRCYGELLVHMRRSPVRSPLRLRIAMGLVAAEHWPQSHARPRTVMSDRAWILVIGWGFAIAMIIHLILIVLIAYVH